MSGYLVLDLVYWYQLDFGYLIFYISVENVMKNSNKGDRKMKKRYLLIVLVVAVAILYLVFVHNYISTIDGELKSIVYMDDRIIVTLVNGTSPVIIQELVIDYDVSRGEVNGSLVYLYNYLKLYEGDRVVIEYHKPIVGSVGFLGIR